VAVRLEARVSDEKHIRGVVREMRYADYATSAPLFADRNCHLPTTDETGLHTSAKYDGARPWRHLKVIIVSLKVIRWRTGSQ